MANILPPKQPCSGCIADKCASFTSPSQEVVVESEEVLTNYLEESFSSRLFRDTAAAADQTTLRLDFRLP